jgi:hypothetical protein
LKQQLSALQDETDDASAGDILQDLKQSLQQWKPAVVLEQGDDVAASSTMLASPDNSAGGGNNHVYLCTGVLGQDQGPNQLQQQQQEQNGSAMKDSPSANGGNGTVSARRFQRRRTLPPSILRK